MVSAIMVFDNESIFISPCTVISNWCKNKEELLLSIDANKTIHIGRLAKTLT